MATNWFERNSKKTIGLIVLVALIGIIFAAEKILAYKYHGFGAHSAQEKIKYAAKLTCRTGPSGCGNTGLT